MKKYFLLLSIFFVGLSACNKGDVVANQAAVDDAKILEYFRYNGVNVGGTEVATKDPSGIYYEIVAAGPTPNYLTTYPKSTSTVKIAYTGKFLDGQSFDTSPSVTLLLSNTVQGFQLGIPHINTGGRIRLYVPSGLGYGPAGSGSIPPNACLIFTIDLLGFF